MPKINRENYTIECFLLRMWNRNWCPDHGADGERDERSGIKRVCCSCLSVADQWRLKIFSKRDEKQFSLNRMSSENEEFSQSKWDFPFSFGMPFSRPIKGRFYCVNMVMNLQFSNCLMDLTSLRSPSSILIENGFSVIFHECPIRWKANWSVVSTSARSKTHFAFRSS